MTGWLFVFLVSERSACEMCQTDTLGTKFLCLFTVHAQDAVSLLDSQDFDVAIAFPQNIIAARSMSRITQTRWDQITFSFNSLEAPQYFHKQFQVAEGLVK